MSKQIDLQKILKKSVKDAMRNDIEPIVKEVYKERAKTLKDLEPSKRAKQADSKHIKEMAANNKGIENNIKDSNDKRIKRTAKKIANRMSDDKYVTSSDKYLAPEFAENGAFSVYNDKPLESIWLDPKADQGDELSFTRLIVEGNILIHPALTSYRNQGRMDKEEWEEYRKYYRFAKRNFVNQAMHDLEKNYKGKFEEMIAERLFDEYNKIK